MRAFNVLGLGRIGALALLGSAACGTADPGGTGGSQPQGRYPDPTPLAPLTMAPLTTERRLTPVKAQEAGALDPRKPDDVKTLIANGYGDETTLPGGPVADRTLDGLAAPAPGPNAKLISRFRSSRQMRAMLLFQSPYEAIREREVVGQLGIECASDKSTHLANLLGTFGNYLVPYTVIFHNGCLVYAQHGDAVDTDLWTILGAS